MLAVALLSILFDIAPRVEVCGTGTTPHRVHEETVAARSRQRLVVQTSEMATESDVIRLEDGIAILTASDRTTYNWKRFDLANQKLRFAPEGNGKFRLTRSSADFATRGSRLAVDSGSAKYDLKGFAFPFNGRSITELYVTPLGAVYFAPPASDTSTWQYSAYQALSPQEGVIAPLLTTSRGSYGANVYVRETADSVTFTWVAANAFHQYEVRAELFRDGTVEFSYPSVTKSPYGGAVVITSGREPWRDIETTLVTAADDVGDAEAPPDVKPVFDITSSSITRNRANRLRFELEMQAPIDFAKIPAGKTVMIGFGINGLQLFIELDRSGIIRTQSPGVSSPGHIDGARLTFDALPTTFRSAPIMDVVISTSLFAGSSGSRMDEIRYAFEMPAPEHVESDFSTLAPSGVALEGPIVETFTVPSLDETGVWEELQRNYGLRNDAWDAVAIYQTFQTDIVFWASAYATFGNPMVKGISNGSGWGTLTSPTLINVDRVDSSRSLHLPRAHLLLHEFGHRWLFHAEFQDGSQSSKALLGRQDAHPHDTVDTRAAYPDAIPLAFSVMGGNHFTEVNGRYRMAEDVSGLSSVALSTGYSWFDLYLMGLADPAEVPATYYIANPVLDRSTGEYAGARVDVTVEQVIRALGKREPAYPNTKRAFKVAFVLLTDPTREPTRDEIGLVQAYRSAFVRDFAVATGCRAWVTTTISPPPARRRSARH